MKRALVVVATAMACGLAAHEARADAAAAEILFREGRRLLDEGKLDVACPKLAESQAQDPSSGTLLNLALCHEKQGKLATAWADYVAAARLARSQGKTDRAEAAEKRASELDPRLPRITIRSTERPAGMEITRGDQHLGPAAIDTAVPVDPGGYEVVAKASGRRAFSTHVEVKEGEAKTVEIPALEPITEAAPAPALPASAPPPAAAAPPPPEALQPPGGSATAGWVVGGAGVVALAVGGVFGASSLASYRKANDACPTHAGCSDDAVSTRDSAEAKAWVSNVALGIGVVAVGVGGYLILSAPGGGTTTRAGVVTGPNGAARFTLERTF